MVKEELLVIGEKLCVIEINVDRLVPNDKDVEMIGKEVIVVKFDVASIEVNLFNVVCVGVGKVDGVVIIDVSIG